MTTSAPVTLTKTSGGGTVSGLPATVNAVNGVVTLPVTGTIAGSIDVQATSSGITSATTTFAVVPGSADHLAFTSSTSDLASGTTRALTVEVRDQQDNRTSSSAAVTLDQLSGAGTADGLPSTIHALDGVATVSVTGASAGAMDAGASSSGLADAATGFSVVPGAANHLTFTSPATDLASGSTRDLRIEVRDAHQNLVGSSTATIAFEKYTGTGTATGIPATVQAAGGVATLAVTGAGAGSLTIGAGSNGVTPAATVFTVLPGAADHLVFTSPTTDLASGDTRDLVVEVRDASENRADSNAAAITFKRSSGPGSVEGLPATVNASGGVATRPVTGFHRGGLTIAASAAGLRSGSTSFKIAPGPRARTLAISLSGSVLKGQVTTRESACRTRVPVSVQMKLTSKHWKTLKHLTTAKSGAFQTHVSELALYRAVVAERPGCAAALSNSARVRARGSRSRAATAADFGPAWLFGAA